MTFAPDAAVEDVQYVVSEKGEHDYVGTKARNVLAQQDQVHVGPASVEPEVDDVGLREALGSKFAFEHGGPDGVPGNVHGGSERVTHCQDARRSLVQGKWFVVVEAQRVQGDGIVDLEVAGHQSLRTRCVAESEDRVGLIDARVADDVEASRAERAKRDFGQRQRSH